MTSPQGILLVCVMADGQALQLVRHGHALRAAMANRAWRVLHLDTLSASYASRTVQQDLAQALRLAQDEGAEIVHAHLSINGVRHLVRQIEQQAGGGVASDVLIGSRAAGTFFWPGYSERLSDFADVLGDRLPRAQIHILVGGKPRARAAVATGTGRWRRTGWPYWRLPLATLLLCTALCELIADHLHPINLILIYLIGVIHVAFRRDLVAAMATLASAVVVFDWIFVAPRWSLKPTDPEYFFTFGIVLCVGLAVSRLALRANEAAARASALADRAQSLHLMAQNLTRAESTQDICRTLQQSVERGVGARADISLGDTPPGPTPAGQDTHRFELSATGGTQGWMVVHDLPSARQTVEDLHLLQALANQAALALERAQLDARGRKAAIEAEAERVRNTLLAGISHDFRTPLTTIIGAATTLLSQGHQITPEQQQALLHHLLGQAGRLKSLTSDLLDLARMQEGAVRPECEWCPVGELARDALALAEGAVPAARVVSRFDEEDMVWCDPRLVTQALANLLLNAARHAPANSPITLAAALNEQGWTLSVRDTGAGLPPGREAEVFRKFHREPESSGPGTGLGLAICEVVAQLHGGTVTARNDQGAVFDMWFPWPAHGRHPKVLHE